MFWDMSFFCDGGAGGFVLSMGVIMHVLEGELSFIHTSIEKIVICWLIHLLNFMWYIVVNAEIVPNSVFFFFFFFFFFCDFRIFVVSD